jgi:chromosome segregation ATPase
LDRQRDLIKFDRDDSLVSSFTEIQRCYDRIRQSEEKIVALRERQPQAFKMAAALPEVKKIVNSIATLIKKNMTLVKETQEYLTGRYERIKNELGELQNSEKILQYLGRPDPSPQFIDGKS